MLRPTPLTIDEKYLLADNIEALKAGAKLLHTIVDRHIDKLLTESIDSGEATKLLIQRAKIDGMRGMISEYEQLISKIIKS